ncbi:hypothetical protein [Pedobacter rhodius]|uniref:Nuclear transport factor 2 family protein n=1 Tax=Pedobacter rhodius TaxID=3004098 RepID=A0ABT4KX50_9SPHI|nr:hypothetical protein [Pedobacter sp. SJ11]MCZ4223345.1 hypothetical protein [Pedobacter sp. SJ11]
MKKILSFLLLLNAAQIAYSQQLSEKVQIQNVLNTFMNCVIKKDSVAFYPLFHKDPIVWVGVVKEKSHLQDLKKNPKAGDLFLSDYRSFIRSMYDASKYEEKFYNVKINEDGFIASVTFDYSFWIDGKKQNWGSESWGLIKTKGLWKITSVIFSVEEENISPEPKKEN